MLASRPCHSCLLCYWLHSYELLDSLINLKNTFSRCRKASVAAQLSHVPQRGQWALRKKHRQCSSANDKSAQTQTHEIRKQKSPVYAQCTHRCSSRGVRFSSLQLRCKCCVHHKAATKTNNVTLDSQKFRLL